MLQGTRSWLLGGRILPAQQRATTTLSGKFRFFLFLTMQMTAPTLFFKASPLLFENQASPFLSVGCSGVWRKDPKLSRGRGVFVAGKGWHLALRWRDTLWVGGVAHSRPSNRWALMKIAPATAHSERPAVSGSLLSVRALDLSERLWMTGRAVIIPWQVSHILCTLI